jgi:hypothetical protein
VAAMQDDAESWAPELIFVGNADLDLQAESG